jgi:hypothetical protein
VTSGSGPDPGWYPDPSEPSYLRWWDGWSWTEHTHPVPSSADAQATEPEAPTSPPPELRLIRTAADAELVAAEWMRWMGFVDAKCTPPGPDGGLDVVATHGVAQVKLYGRPIGRPDLQQLYGAALGEPCLFFAAEGYTDEAVAWAETAEMALFRFDRQGEPAPVNRFARGLLQGGGQGLVRPPEPPPEPPTALPQPKLALPLSCSDAAATSMISGQRTGIISREAVDWVVQSWILLYLVRLDYTHAVGQRQQVRQSAVSIHLSSLTGLLFPFQAAPEVIASARPTTGAMPLFPRVSAEQCIKDTVDLWNRYCQLTQPAARVRYQGELRARGIPVGIARSVRLIKEAEVLLPIFIGQLSHSTGARLVLVDGCAARVLPDESVAMTSRLGHVVASLTATGARRIPLN